MPEKSKYINRSNATLLLSFILFFSLQLVQGQNVKQFQGAFENGNATYQYFENENYERIYHGSFKYKGTVIDGLKGKLALTVNGQYSNNKKEGKWVYILADPMYTGVTETITGNYIGGEMDGEWTSVTIANKTKKTFKNTAAIFRKNKLFGEINYSYKAFTFKEFASITVKGSFNDSSMFHGTWLTNYTQGNIQFEEIRKYRDGVLYFLVHRRLSDGNILEKFDSTAFVDKFFLSYNPKQNIALVENQKYLLKNSNKYSGTLEIPMVVVNYWTSYNKGGYYNTLSAPNPMFVISHGYTPLNIIREKQIVNWLTTQEGQKQQWQAELEKKMSNEKYTALIMKADTAFAKKDYTLAIETYKSALAVNENQYPKDQIQKAQLKLDELRIAKEQEQKAKEKAYNELIIKADGAFKEKKYDLAIELYKSALEVKKDEYPTQQIKLITQVKVEESRLILVSEIEKNWVSIEGGSFKMGCMRSDISCLKNEEPVREVTLGQFFMSKYEVTTGQYRTYCKVTSKPEPQGTDNLPVTNVSWKDATDFAAWLGCRLPTEAEWEYSARGGNKNKKTIYSGSNDIEEVAWFSENATGAAHAGGQKLANVAGIFDMTGNVWEWCSDWYNDYPSRDEFNPQGPNSGNRRVKRGGSFNEANFESDLRVTNRASEPAETKLYNLGFRLVKK